MTAPLPLIDCRPATQFAAGHIRGATSLPAGELFARMHELPMRDKPLALCGDSESLAAARDFLVSHGHVIAEIILLDRSATQSCVDQGVWQQGPQSARLWQPADLLRELLANSSRWEIGRGSGLDIACGSGRNLVYLAENGWSMSGVDYLQDALDRSQRLAGYNQVSVDLLLLDIESETGINALVDRFAGSCDLVTVFRYLHRPLLPVIDCLLKPGGVMVYQTFMQGCENIGRPRNPNYLLKAGELAGVFDGYQILLDEVELLADSRPVSAFIARKPGA